MKKRPPYVPDCCCYKDPLEIRNDPGLAFPPDADIEGREIDYPDPPYLFRNGVSL